jgi:enoyl-CoA hydratase/carnithine racemase
LELLFSGDIIDASEALRLGLVKRVVAADALADATRELAERFASGPTLAYGFAKAAVYESANRSFESLLDFEAGNQRIAGRSEDVQEGIRSFLERRKPEFRGR